MAVLFVREMHGEVQFYSDCGHLYLVSIHDISVAVNRTGILGCVMGGKIESWN